MEHLDPFALLVVTIISSLSLKINSAFEVIQNSEKSILFVVSLNKKLKNLTNNIDFSEICITSKAEVIQNDNTETTVITTKAKGSKCSTCWKIKEVGCERSTCPNHS